MSAEAVLLDVLAAVEHLPVDEALAVESLAYSMLLAGPEFRAWLERRGPMTPEPSADPVLLARTGDVLTVTLNRPERHNAYDAGLRDALVDALEVAVLDPDVRVVLRGNGRSFCQGGDLAEFGTTPDVVTAHAIRTERSPARLLAQLGGRLRVEVHGACIGSGLELAAWGHVVAQARTVFHLPEVAMGLIPGAGGTVSLGRRLGRERAAEVILHGRRFGTAQAVAWGLVDETC